MKDRLGKDLNIYAAIAAHSRRTASAANLLGGASSTPPQMPGLIDLADGRVMSGGLQLDLVKKKTVCTSFNADWTCLRCGEHGAAPAFKIRGIPDSTAARQVVVLADQAFPACLPAMGSQECLRIILVESGSILDLVETFLQKLGNRRVPPGSVILIFSASFLQMVGLELYAAELVQAQNRIHSVLGKETICQPLPPVLLGGTDDQALIRSVWELITWSDQYFAGSDYLEKSSITAKKILQQLGTGVREALEARRYALPANKEKTKRVWASEGEARAMPCAIRALTPNSETEYVRSLIAEIREKWALDLDPTPKLDRSLGPQLKPRRKVDVLVVGSSNAQKLAAALRTQGKHCDVLFSAGWTVSRPNAEFVADKIRKAIADEDPDLIVLQLLDNSVFYARAEDGSRVLPRKGADNWYHVEGELQICGRESQISQLEAFKPILDAVGKKNCLWVAPMPRYLHKNCCADPSHITNRNHRFFQEDMEEQLDRYKWGMKEHMRALGRKNIKILDPSYDLRSMAEHEVWGDDPVHPSEAAYSKIATAALAMQSLFSPVHPPVRHDAQDRPQLGGGHRGGGGGRSRRPYSHRGQGRGYGPAGGSRDGRDQRDNADYNRRGRHYDPDTAVRGRSGYQDYRARPY
jgi:hypothetical protein